MGWFLDVLGAGSGYIEHHIGAFTAVLAVAAIIQWRETRKTGERQLRAYVLNFSVTLLDGTNMDPKPFVDRSGQPGVIVEIKNFGQTPALEVLHWCEMRVALVRGEMEVMPPAKLERIHPSVIGPGGTNSNSRWLDRSLSPQELEGIKNGTYAIFVYGRIEYKDVFGATRWSTYKLRHTNGAWPPLGTGTIGMNFCSSGNDAN